MTKPLNPEIKAIRAVHRALDPIGPEEQRRILEWAVARRAGLPGIRLPAFPAAPSSQKVGERTVEDVA